MLRLLLWHDPGVGPSVVFRCWRRRLKWREGSGDGGQGKGRRVAGGGAQVGMDLEQGAGGGDWSEVQVVGKVEFGVKGDLARVRYVRGQAFVCSAASKQDMFGHC